MASVLAIDDTIVAIATPPGRGGIGVVRVSGPDATGVARALVTRRSPLQPRYATLTYVRVSPATSEPAMAGPRIDRVVATYYPAPHSYTGDDVVEISAHGSPVVLHRIVEAAVGAGARLARAGEFTLRAFLNGRIDLTQAEAVGDLIEAATPLQADAAFDQLHGTLAEAIAAIGSSLLDLTARLEASIDFPDEGYHFVDPAVLALDIETLRDSLDRFLQDARRGRLIREGLHAAIVGPPNAGKSSLFNALVGGARAIVSEAPGTTRDVVMEVVEVEGLRVTLADTAGLRVAGDAIEAEGMRRTEDAAATADVVLVVGDRSNPEDREVVRELLARYGQRGVAIANKADRLAAWSLEGAVDVSATTGQGMDDVRRGMVERLDVDWVAERPAMTNIRHIALADRARAALDRARAAALTEGVSLSEEFVLADLREARQSLEEITGHRTPEDVLAHIFARFCIGK